MAHPPLVIFGMSVPGYAAKLGTLSTSLTNYTITYDAENDQSDIEAYLANNQGIESNDLGTVWFKDVTDGKFHIYVYRPRSGAGGTLYVSAADVTGSSWDELVTNITSNDYYSCSLPATSETLVRKVTVTLPTALKGKEVHVYWQAYAYIDSNLDTTTFYRKHIAFDWLENGVVDLESPTATLSKESGYKSPATGVKVTVTATDDTGVVKIQAKYN